ncbi:transcriptional regulator, partial [Pseudonocardia pini]|uniref:transcriptional regulator n=1 Tax=Pseudonocardia pini TaxID=2758030 RepID=UPI0015F0D267
GHLAKLTAGGLLTVEARGRQRWYRYAGPAVGNLVEALEQLAPTATVTSLRQANRAKALREARTCYGHLSGRLGVALMESLLDRGHLDGRTGHDPDDVDYALTESGERFLTDFGVPARPRAAEHCLDWSEHRHHLGGPLGRALLDRFLELGWVRRTEISRAVAVTTAGSDGLATTFGIHAEPGAHR